MTPPGSGALAAIHERIDVRLRELVELYGLIDLRKPSGERLTERELQVATYAAAGLSNREIGRRMFLSEDTIKSHLRATFVKLGIRRRALLQQVLRGVER